MLIKQRLLFVIFYNLWQALNEPEQVQCLPIGLRFIQ